MQVSAECRAPVWPGLESTWTLAERATRGKLIARREKKEREPAGPNRVVPAEGGGEVEYRGKTGAENKRRGNDRNKVKEKEKEGNGRE